MKKLLILASSLLALNATAATTGQITSHVNVDQVCSLDVIDPDMNLTHNMPTDADMAKILITNNKIGGRTSLKTDDVQFKGISAQLIYKNDGSGNGLADTVVTQQAVTVLDVKDQTKVLSQEYQIGHQSGMDFETKLGAGHHVQQVNLTVICE